MNNFETPNSNQDSVNQWEELFKDESANWDEVLDPSPSETVPTEPERTSTVASSESTIYEEPTFIIPTAEPANQSSPNNPLDDYDNTGLEAVITDDYENTGLEAVIADDGGIISNVSERQTETQTFDSNSLFEKSEEERTYEAREKNLKAVAKEVITSQSKDLERFNASFCEIIEKDGRTKGIHEAINGIKDNAQEKGEKTLQSFFGFIDSVFPSPYSGKSRNFEEIMEKAVEYNSDATEEGKSTSSLLDGLADIIGVQGTEIDRDAIAQRIKNIGGAAKSYKEELAGIIIGCFDGMSNKPDSRFRTAINGRQSSYSGEVSVLTRTIRNNINSSSLVRNGKDLEEPVETESQELLSSSARYAEAVIDYIDFKATEYFESLKKNGQPVVIDSKEINDELSRSYSEAMQEMKKPEAPVATEQQPKLKVLENALE